MDIIRQRPSQPNIANPDNFSGEVFSERLASVEGLRVFRVRFTPGARTAWHAHTGTQLLLIDEGRGWVQREGQPVQEVGPGDMVYVAPGERHWHGAAPDCEMTHRAINAAGETNWFERVSDQQYRR